MTTIASDGNMKHFSGRRILRAGVRPLPAPSYLFAFTLIELLVVITIIAVLLGLLVPVTSMVMDNARSSGCKTKLHQFGMAWEAYANDNEGFYIITTRNALNLKAISDPRNPWYGTDVWYPQHIFNYTEKLNAAYGNTPAYCNEFRNRLRDPGDRDASAANYMSNNPGNPNYTQFNHSSYVYNSYISGRTNPNYRFPFSSMPAASVNQPSGTYLLCCGGGGNATKLLVASMAISLPNSTSSGLIPVHNGNRVNVLMCDQHIETRIVNRFDFPNYDTTPPSSASTIFWGEQP